MNNILTYKGYSGSVEYSPEDNVLYGKILGIRSLVQYDAGNIDELTTCFREAVDDYLEVCTQEGIEPEKAYPESVTGQWAVNS